MYNYVLKPQALQGTPVNLYRSTRVTEDKLKKFSEEYEAFPEYYQLFPIFLEKFFINHRKNFVVSMDFYKQNGLLKLTCLAHSGVYEKLVSVNNVIPATYGDYVASSKFNLFEIPPLVDHEMIYFNEAQREFYLFDRQGKWEDYDNESLSIDKLYDENKFLDQYFR